ncbi:MAG: MFS transporter [Betaproteobacteria bacterium]|nr:MFS transporter [Betaproteobacteria bacterium]MDE2122766.1 MFS transporter [Betaproteobacteria bacterium]MDE2185706.1 MFS transporter [Betaproteobacteria bacterium]MDE2325374.1 MFS transporter [Betaproteobacteria bacterium]
MSNSSISERMDRLPITRPHRIAILALAFAYFFEFADLNTFAFAAPGVMKDWHIAVSAVAFITSASFGGMFLGAVTAGWLADAIGRKRALILTVLCYALFSLLNAASWNVLSLAAFRFLTGVGLSGMTVTANTYVSEFFPANVRGKTMGRIMTVGLVGIPATAWFARAFVPMASWGWRAVFVWGSLGLFALLFIARMKESPRWLLRRNREAQALAIVEELEALAAARPVPAIPAAAHVHHEPIDYGRRVPLARLFEPAERKRTLILVLVWVFQTLGFYGFVAWVPTLLVKHGFSVVHSLTFASVIAVCNPLGAILASYLVERFERRWFITVDGILIAAFGLGFGLSFQPEAILVFGGLVMLSIQAMAVGLYTYTPEMFPTDVRSTGMGLTYGVGRLANVLGPFVVSTLFEAYGYGSVFIYIAACWLVVSAVVGLFGTSTTGRSLEALHAADSARQGALR